MCSAKGSVQTVLRSLQSGAIDFVVKPFHAECLISSIDRSSNEKRKYNNATVSALLHNKEFDDACAKKPVSQSAINRLLDICTREFEDNYLDIVDICSETNEVNLENFVQSKVIKSQ